MSTTDNKHDLATSEGGRGYLADLFRTRLKRHDFTVYIDTALAADFACVLSRFIKPLVDCGVDRDEPRLATPARRFTLDELRKMDGNATYVSADDFEGLDGMLDESESLAALHCNRANLAEARRKNDSAELERYRLVGCTSCDGSGHLHSIVGDYHGACTSCPAYELEQANRNVGSLMHERDTLRTKLTEAEGDLATYREHYVTRTAYEAAMALAVPK